MARLFLSQQQVDRLIADEHATLVADQLDLPSLALSFQLEPAVHFTAIVDGEDSRDLVGRVKGEAALKAAGMDILHTSAIVGDSAYECEQGFLAEPPADDPRWIEKVSGG